MEIAYDFILKALRLHLRNSSPFFLVHCADLCMKHHRKEKIYKGVVKEVRIPEISCSEWFSQLEVKAK
jgi:hypothetical protein